MTHYLVAQVKVQDPAWIPEYAAKVHDIVHRHGGKYLTRCGNILPIEGDALAADMVAILQFPSLDALQAFVKDPEYAPFAKVRQNGASSILFALDTSDAAGTIPYLI